MRFAANLSFLFQELRTGKVYRIRRPDGSLHEVPMTDLGTSNGSLVATVSGDQIDAMRTM